MRTELDRLRLRQRRYEWELAREAHAAAANHLVSGKTHDLLNLVQIIQLATAELAKHSDASGKEFVDDLERAAVDAQRSLAELMAIARPERAVAAGAPIGAALTMALETIRGFVALDVHLAVAPDTVTACNFEDLEHLVIGLALDVLGEAPRIELLVREREIDGKPWVELVRSAIGTEDGEHFELRVVEAIAARAGGELARSQRREGGIEVVVALPVVR